MLRPGLIALLCALTVGAAGLLVPAVGGAAAVAPHGAPAATIADLPRPVGPRVLLLFLPAREKPAKVPPTVKNPPNPQEIVQKRIDDRKQPEGIEVRSSCVMTFDHEQRDRSHDTEHYERCEDGKAAEASTQQQNEEQDDMPDEAHRPEQEIDTGQIHSIVSRFGEEGRKRYGYVTARSAAQ